MTTSRSPATAATDRLTAALLAVLALGCQADRPAKPLTLGELEPAYGDPSGGKLVQIVGADFDTHSKVTVMFGSVPARAIVVAKDRIQLESPPGKAGEEVEVTVRFPDGRSGTCKQHYRWQVGDAAP